MLLSLISVLVLLVIAFYAVWVGVMGRVNGNEGPELSFGGRALVIGIALVAFGAAYLVYSSPRKDSIVTAEAPAAMPSNPPESRGSPVAATAAPVAETEPVATQAQEMPKATGAETPTESAPTATTTPARSAADELTASSDDNAGLSAGAAQLEADRAQPARQPAKAAPFTAAVKMPAEAAVVTIDAPATRPVSYASRAVSPARSRGARGRLVLHVQNALGSDQQREQLTLSIEGKAVADIEVNDSRPTVAVAVPLPRPGLLHYRLEGISESDGTTRLVGEGCIRVRDGARFAVRRRDGSSKVFLEASRVAG